MSERRFAVLVGSSEFRQSNGELLPLRCPLADVAGLQKTLDAPELGGFTETKVLKNEPHYQVLFEIEKVLYEAEREDLVLIFYSGHGKLDTAGNLYLATINTVVPQLKATSIPLSQVRDMVDASRCRRIVIMLDCCYGGAAGKSFLKGSVDEKLQDIANGRGTFIMTASTALQAATEKEGDTYSVFTKHVLEGIRTGNADLNGDGQISMDELFRYVERRVTDEAAHQPRRWDLNASGALVISRALLVTAEERMRSSIRRTLDELSAAEALPSSLLRKAYENLELSAPRLTGRPADYRALLVSLTEKRLKPIKFIEEWYSIDSGLPCRNDEPAIAIENRWQFCRAVRPPILDLSVPTYILDSRYHMVDWNPAFEEIIARPLGLVRGRHAEDFILRLRNSAAVVQRSLEVFKPGDAPLVDGEVLEFDSESYGLIRFRKLASQIPDPRGRTLAWCIQLNILSAERESELWHDLEEMLRAQVNWSRYAVSYDRILTHFDPYTELVTDVTGMVDGQRRCIDLGAGTGNGTLKLLEDDPEREVWAVESNHSMLEYMLEKTRARHGKEDLAERLFIVKGDLLLSMREFEAEFFDAAVMINVLYSVAEPQRCLQQVYRILKPGGVLALSTSHRDTDVDRLFTEIRKDLRAKQRFAELRENVEDAYERHKAMDARIHRDMKEDIHRYVEAAGFEIVETRDPAYVGAVVIIKAIKN